MTLVAEPSACRQRHRPLPRSHLFTTIWVPGTSLKPIKLGWWRFHHCRVGHHWTIVPLVEASGSIDEDRALAAEHTDIRIP